MASCLAAEAVPKISAPTFRAIWVAAMPTPPAAEWISTRLSGAQTAHDHQRGVRGPVVHAEGRTLGEGQAVGQGKTSRAWAVASSA